MESNFIPCGTIESDEDNSSNPFNLKTTCIRLKHSQQMRKLTRFKHVYEETALLVQHSNRNNFICDLSCKLKGNTLVLFHYIEKHGELLYKQIETKVKKDRADKNVLFSAGIIDISDEETLREEMHRNNENIILSSHSRVYDRDFKISSVDNIILAVPWKDEIRNSYSIGKGLSLKEGKTHANLYDLMDDMQTLDWTNHFTRRAKNRMKVYAQEKNVIKTMSVEIN